MTKISRKKYYWPFISVVVVIGTILASCFFIARQFIPSTQPNPSDIQSFLPYGAFPKVSATTPIAATDSAQPAKPTVNQPATPSSPSSSTGVPILMYHYVGNNPDPKDRQRDILSITPDKLEAQFNWLRQNGYTPITLDTLYGLFAKKESISKPVVLTFDDGYVDFYYNAFQILRKYNFHAVSFIPTGLVGKPAYMTWDQIKEIRRSGLVSFQAHSVTHPNLTSLPYSQMQNELLESKKTLEQELGTHVNFVAYPYGNSNADTWRTAQLVGFLGGVGTWYGKAAGPGINMPRIRITGTISLGEFAQKMAN